MLVSKSFDLCGSSNTCFISNTVVGHYRADKVISLLNRFIFLSSRKKNFVSELLHLFLKFFVFYYSLSKLFDVILLPLMSFPILNYWIIKSCVTTLNEFFWKSLLKLFPGLVWIDLDFLFWILSFLLKKFLILQLPFLFQIFYDLLEVYFVMFGWWLGLASFWKLLRLGCHKSGFFEYSHIHSRRCWFRFYLWRWYYDLQRWHVVHTLMFLSVIRL